MALQRHEVWKRVADIGLIFLLTCCLDTAAALVDSGNVAILTSSVSAPTSSDKTQLIHTKQPEPETGLNMMSPTPTSGHVPTTTSSLALCPGLATDNREDNDNDDDAAEPAPGPVELRVVGLFGINGSYPTGRAFQVAAELAVEDINKRPDVLPGYKLILEPVNSQCNTAVGMDLLYRKLFTENTTKIMVLGGTCSGVSEQTSTAARKYNMVQISYSALSARLSEPDFPWFFRVMAPEKELSLVRVLMLVHFNWTNLTVVQASEHLFSSTAELMTAELHNHNITLDDSIPFEKETQRAIEKLQKKDARIIYFASYEDEARRACCEAFRMNMTGSKIVWIFPGFFDLKWYDVDDHGCSAKDKLKVIDGYLTVLNVALAPEESGDYVGTNKSDYLRRFRDKALWHLKNAKEADGEKNNKSEILLAGQGRAPLAYDTMWTIALALNSTLTEYIQEGEDADVLKKFSYTNIEMGNRILRNMKNTSFRGLSGNLSFTSTGDRIPQIAVKQFRVLDNDEVVMKVIGLYTDKQMRWFDDVVFWKGGKVPVSRLRTERVLRPLSWSLYLTMSFLAALGVLLCLAFLIFNVRHRNVRLIKMSSPNINNLILVGCMLVYPTVVVENVKGLKIEWFCHVRLYLMVLGFSLGYGSLFAKIWRVYEIMTASRKLTIVTKDLRDSRLLLTVGVLVAINLGLLILWTALDSLTLKPEDIEDSAHLRNQDVQEIQQTLVCNSEYKIQFTMGLLALQALLILFGAFLAFQTRKMTIPELNDSRWVGLCIYNVVVLGSLGVILVLGTRQPPHVVYLLESVMILVGTTLTQCLVFVPKLLAYRRIKRNQKNGNSMSRFNVKVMCMSATASSSSASIRSNFSANLDTGCPRGHKDEEEDLSAPPSPTKALRIAGQSLSAALKRCCSAEVMHKYMKDQQQQQQQQQEGQQQQNEGDAQQEKSPLPQPPPQPHPPVPFVSHELLSASSLLSSCSFVDAEGKGIVKRSESVGETGRGSLAEEFDHIDGASAEDNTPTVC